VVKIEANMEFRELISGEDSPCHITKIDIETSVDLGIFLRQEGQGKCTAISEFNIARQFHLIHQIKITRRVKHSMKNYNKVIIKAANRKVRGY
jgi:hypothetical protein